MKTMLGFLSAVLLAGCQSPEALPIVDTEVAPPTEGALHRYVVDALTLPVKKGDLADDLNGDGKLDNQLGLIVGALTATADLTEATPELLADGVLSPIVEITGEPAEDGTVVGLRFRGADGEAADLLGARVLDGVLRSGRTRVAAHSTTATLHLPLFKHADPLVLPVYALEADVTPDGKGGFDAVLRGAIPRDAAFAAAHVGYVQMIEANPSEFPGHWAGDLDRDGQLSQAEFDADFLVKSVLAPDVQLFDGDRFAPQAANQHKDSISFGLALHLSPCESGRCAVAAAPVHLCEDRLRDGDESDVDCGGSCLPCAGGRDCASGSDCQSGSCVDGACAQVSCTDGVRDGLETGADCGGPSCGVCPGE